MPILHITLCPGVYKNVRDHQKIRALRYLIVTQLSHRARFLIHNLANPKGSKLGTSFIVRLASFIYFFG